MDRRAFLAAAAGCAAAVPLAGCCPRTVELSGLGATFPAPIYARWIALFERQHERIRLHYEPVGSTRGIEGILARTHDFA